jgi:glycosyltransferase involved in cell wall biosynthesis
LAGTPRLAEIFRRERPAVVQTWLYHADLLGFLAARLAGRPPVAWNIRCAELDPRDHPTSLRWVLSALARLSSRTAAIVVNSQAGQQANEQLGYRSRRWVSIPNGFDVSHFAPRPDARDDLRRELGVAGDTPLVGLVARFHPMKDHDTFLRAARSLHRDRADVHFVLAGRQVDPANAALTTAVRHFGIESVVHLLGEREDVSRLTAALDVATCSSYSEGFPNVIGEAMASGVPCVATDVGDMRVLIGETGVIVPPRHPDALAEGWRQLLGLSSARRAALGAAARARIAERFEIGAVARQYETLYDELAASRAPE